MKKLLSALICGMCLFSSAQAIDCQDKYEFMDLHQTIQFEDGYLFYTSAIQYPYIDYHDKCILDEKNIKTNVYRSYAFYEPLQQEKWQLIASVKGFYNVHAGGISNRPTVSLAGYSMDDSGKTVWHFYRILDNLEVSKLEEISLNGLPIA